MNQDEELNLDSKLKVPQRESRPDVKFLHALRNRSIGLETRGLSNTGFESNTGFNLQARAEDELVKKQFKEMRCEMPGMPRSTFLMVFSPDGTKVASTHGNHNIYITDVRTGKNIKTLLGHPRTPWCIAFHPTSNQIIASGCLGGQVRIWDLSGGSEVWTAESQTVISSIAFHPDERLLVIATNNELFFWDWSKPEPFLHVATGSTKEKVRYVAFDKLGHKLITGITNSPQTRWERVRAPVPVPRPADRAASPYRRRITPRLITNLPSGATPINIQCTRPSTSREPLSSVPERERRITTCYRDLVHQYEVLVHRYLQIYRPPVMIDQGTDPMEIESPPTDQPSTSSEPPAPFDAPTPSTSQTIQPDPSTPSTSAAAAQVLKKSSASQPAKNKSKKPKTDTSGPSTSGTSSTLSESSTSNGQSPMQLNSNIALFSRKTSKTIGSTQTSAPTQCPIIPSNDAVTASLSSTNPQKINQNSSTTSDDANKIDFHIQIQRNADDNNSSSEDEERFLSDIIADFETRNSSEERNQNLPSTSNAQPGQTEDQEQRIRDLAIYRYLNLTRRCDTEVMRERLSPNVTRVTMTRRFVIPPSSENSNTEESAAKPAPAKSSNAGNNPTTSSTQEPTYKMRIKCSVKPNTNETESGENQESTPKPSTSSTNTQNSDHISDLIRNAEIMLAQFRQNLEQRGNLQNSEAPSTSGSTVPPQPENQGKPSKSTNTTQRLNASAVRKRGYPYIKKLKRHPPVSWAVSSDSSSSDDEQRSKRDRPMGETPSTDHSYAGTSFQVNEHSYAGLTGTNLNPDDTVRIEIDLSSFRDDALPTDRTEAPNDNNPPPANDANSNPVDFFQPVTLSFAELEREVNEVYNNRGNTPSPEIPDNTNESNDSNERVCGTCGGTIEDRTRRSENNNANSCRTYICSRTLFSNNNNNNNTAATTNTPPTSEPLRCRLLSHRLSAFHPTRLTPARSLRSPSFLLRNRLGNLNSNESPTRSQSFAPDEVINYSERMNEEEAPRGYHPFDPPPELMSINPENIGIGNMYSNIVQELESSLNDVRNIRYNRRLGETSDMLSSFSERLESIMNQSNAILRNLSTSLETLPVNDNDRANSESLTRVFRSLRTLGILTRNNPEDPLYDLVNPVADSRRNAFNTSNPLTSDHTYPLNPENPQMANMSPLMVSLHLTVSHIQRQARLLRQQVESIERIDRAMLEVAQLQMMRQMFDELHGHFSSISGSGGVSSVRQMMAGTRISDSSPYDSPPSDDNTQNQNTESEPQASTSSATQDNQNQNTRTRSRKTNPRCLFLMHRQFKRSINLILGSRRNNNNNNKDRVTKRNMYRRFVPNRPNTRPNVDTSSNRGRGLLNLFNPDTLTYMTRRLEHFLMEHGRYIGRSVIPTNNSSSSSRSVVGEHIMMLRLGICRRRMNRILGLNYDTNRNNHSRVTVDGSTRFGARQTLSSILDTLTRYMDANTSTQISQISTHFRSHIWEVIELSLMLSEILLLQIVDSIPPPSGMNLDPERESLSMRIDQMCSRMLQSRLSGQSHQLTRSLRLLRLTVRHATQALGQTYTARRNAMLPSNSDNERLGSRQGLLYDIRNCLRNIRRHRETSSTRVDNVTNPTGREWYRTINDLITTTNSPSQESTSNSVLNSETGEDSRPPTTIEDANSSDDNNSTSNNNTGTRIYRPLYRTSNVNLLNNEESSTPGPRNRLWNVPTVTVNDVPVTESPHSPWHPRFLANRQRLSERLDELRTTGGLFRPRFLHPMYAGPNPFEPDLDDLHREQMYDSDIIANVTPNHRIQVWEFSHGTIPNINNALKNVVVTECKIHNDASVDYASDGSILVTLLPSGGYMNISNRLGVYSLEWETLGQCLYQTSFEQNAVSVSLSPLNRHLIVGLASRRIPIMPSDKWTMAQIFLLDEKDAPFVKLSPIRELEQNRDANYMSVNCIRWLPTSGQGLVFATNTGHLRFLT